MSDGGLSNKDTILLTGRIYPAIRSCISNRYKIILGIFVYYAFIVKLPNAIEPSSYREVSIFASIILTLFVLHNSYNYLCNAKEKIRVEGGRFSAQSLIAEGCFCLIALLLIWGAWYFITPAFAGQVSSVTVSGKPGETVFIKESGLASWLVAIGTILLAFVAAFQGWIHRGIAHPWLELSIDLTERHDCHKTIMKVSREVITREGNLSTEVAVSECFYFRFRVANSGSIKADNVEVMITSLEKENEDGTYNEVKRFFPFNLVWSNYGGMYMQQISPGTFKHCDLGHILHPEKRREIDFEDDPRLQVNKDDTVFSFDFLSKPHTTGHLIEPGIYRFTVLVAAANTGAREQAYELVLRGQWYDDPEMMFTEGIAIKPL